MNTKITIVCDNHVWGGYSFIAEHGFSVCIEREDEIVLFDTGQGVGLINNLRRLNIDLKSINKIALSHGHYDHTGGLLDVLFPERDIKIIAHPEIWSEKYVELKRDNSSTFKYVGIPFKRSLLESMSSVEFLYTKEFKEISQGIFFSGEIKDRDKRFEVQDKRLKVLKGGKFVDDPFLDDISMLVETSKGPVVILGCAHSGIINILNHFKKYGYTRFYAIIGGSHLGFVQDKNFIHQIFDLIDDFNPQLMAFGHCTGFKAMSMCADIFKDRFVFPFVGWSLEA